MSKEWKMRKPTKMLLGIATALPFLHLIFFMVSFFGLFVFDVLLKSQTAPAAKSDGPPFFFLALFALHFLMILWTFALVAFYIVHLFKTERVPTDKKALWAVVLFFAGMFAMPVYWYLYIWRDAPITSTPPSG